MEQQRANKPTEKEADQWVAEATLRQQQEETERAAAAAEKGDEINNELDDLLDEIDDVLEVNAEEFVKAYVQKGGEQSLVQNKLMIKFIAAVDSKLGIADEHGIPWQGKIPGDVKYYRERIKNGFVVMGLGLYEELSKPYEAKVNYVATRDNSVQLRDGFTLTTDAAQLMQELDGEVWNLGGAALFASTFDLADELYLTQLQADFNCTKFFPEFKDKFDLESESEPITENEITYTFQVWTRKQLIYIDQAA